MDSRSLLRGNLPNPGIEPRSPTLQADALTSAPHPTFIRGWSSQKPFLKASRLDFPGGPVAKTLCPDAENPGWIPGQGTRSHMPQKKAHLLQLRPGSVKLIDQCCLKSLKIVPGPLRHMRCDLVFRVLTALLGEQCYPDTRQDLIRGLPKVLCPEAV